MPPCPTCQQPATKRNGRDRRGRQKYACRPCRCTLTENSGSAFSGYRWSRDIIVMAVRWYLAYPLSSRQVLELLAELPNRKNPGGTIKRVYLPEAELGLTGELLLWVREQCLADEEPLFFSRKGGADGSRRALRRGQAWLIVKEASERAAVLVLALRPSKHGLAGEPAPVHPHLFRHARVRQFVRVTRSLPLAQRQAGWGRLQMAYLTFGDDEARQMRRQVI